MSAHTRNYYPVMYDRTSPQVFSHSHKPKTYKHTYTPLQFVHWVLPNERKAFKRITFSYLTYGRKTMLAHNWAFQIVILNRKLSSPFSESRPRVVFSHGWVECILYGGTFSPFSSRSPIWFKDKKYKGGGSLPPLLGLMANLQLEQFCLHSCSAWLWERGSTWIGVLTKGGFGDILFEPI